MLYLLLTRKHLLVRHTFIIMDKMVLFNITITDTEYIFTAFS